MQRVCLSSQIMFIKVLLFSFVFFIFKLVFAALLLSLLIVTVKMLLSNFRPQERRPHLIDIVLLSLHQLIGHLIDIRGDSINDIHVTTLPECVGNILTTMFVDIIWLIGIVRISV